MLILINHNHPFFLMLIMFFAESLIFFLYLIQRHLTKIQKTNSSGYEIIPGKQKIKKLFIIIGLGVCDLSTSMVSDLLNSSNVASYTIIFKAMYFFFTTCLSIYMLKYQFYRHHYLGIGIYFIGLVWYTLVDLLYDMRTSSSIETSKTNSTPVWLVIIIMVVTQFLGSLGECSEKYLMDKMYISPFAVISIEGISGFILVLILIPVMSLVQCNTTFFKCKGTFSASFYTIFSEISWNQAIVYIIIYMIIILFFLNTFKSLANQHYSPLHRNLSNTFSTFFHFFFNVFYYKTINNTVGYIILLICGHLFMILGVLIYLEIIILNFCGLNHNTKAQIDIRESKDYEEVIEIIDTI